MLLGIAGAKRSGKSTAAQYLASRYGMRVDTFAGPIREFVRAILGWSEVELEDRKEEPLPWLGNVTARSMMQTVGTEWGRKTVHGDVWVLSALRRSKPTIDAGHGVILADVRFPNEAEAIRVRGGRVLRVVRDVAHSADQHASEKPLPANLIDEDVANNGTIRDLYINLDAAMERMGFQARYPHG